MMLFGVFKLQRKEMERGERGGRRSGEERERSRGGRERGREEAGLTGCHGLYFQSTAKVLVLKAWSSASLG